MKYDKILNKLDPNVDLKLLIFITGSSLCYCSADVMTQILF